MTDWRSRWPARVASDVSTRDGIGWEFEDFRQRAVWFVFREDGGDFPVFSARRGEGPLPPRQDLAAMTEEAVADLLVAADLPDQSGWLTRNISAALLLASREVLTWEGVEWALESGADDVALVWATPADGRSPFAWLRGRGVEHDFVIDIYQDDGVFGLNFIPVTDPQLPLSVEGSLRPRRDLPLVTGRINKVEVVLDTLVEGGSCSGLVTEALLHGDSSSTLLIAAEACTRDQWHLYDESITVLANVASADALDWIPARRSWRPTEAPGR